MNTKRTAAAGKTSQEVTANAVSTGEVFEPITRIGIETELSRYPVHNLAKKGAVNIQVTKRGPEGVVDLKWEVSYSDRYGQARQVAYKIDTIIVNRKIDEAGRPLPKFIKIGTLTDMCKDLGLTPGGQNKNMVKKGILQNASAFITAKLKYRTKDGGERTLEAGFTRYSVTFTGEKLPDGREADAIYIVINEPYREVLNNAPIRPLNYAYLKELAPSPQRFYEIISSRIYAAIKNKSPLARIPYSEFCTYSALMRHTDFENFRVQMSKVVRPHLQMGYIARATYEVIEQENGADPDWMMCYKPGPRAMAEYMRFTHKKRMEEEGAADIEATAIDLGIVETAAPEPPPSAAAHPLEPELIARGVSANKARSLLASLAPGQRVADQLEWADQVLASEPARFKNPAGFYVYAVGENVAPPPDFESSAQRAEREQSQATHDAEYNRLAALRLNYEEFCYRRVEEFAQGLSSLEVKELSARKRKEISALIKSFSQMTADNQRNLVWNAVKAEVKPRVEMPSFEEFTAGRVSWMPTTEAETPLKARAASKGSSRKRPTPAEAPRGVSAAAAGQGMLGF